MTEQEWLACDDPAAMLAPLRRLLSDRKLRLFCCACCRRVWSYVRDDRLNTALDSLEQYADGAASDKPRIEAAKLASAVRLGLWDETGREEEVCIACELVAAAGKKLSRSRATFGDSAATAFAWAKVGDFDARKYAERKSQTRLFRDIFGNPFRPPARDLGWLTSTVVALARGIYAERAFDRMPILADALQDAGCTSEEVLTHCRDVNATHVRGCWVVDLMLGKA